MRKVFVVAAVMAAVAMVPAAASAGSSQVRLASSVPAWVQHAQLTQRPARGQMLVTVYLRMRNQQGLGSLVTQLYRTGSPQFHRFLSPAQFRTRFSPSRAAVRAVRAFLVARGLRIVGTSPKNGAYVDATGSVAQVERAFGVSERVYHYRGLYLRGSAQAPRVPASLAKAVLAVDGLADTQRLVRPQLETNPGAPPGPGYATPGPCSTYWADHTATVTPPAYQYGSSLPWTPCGYTPAQMRAAYGVNATGGLTGAGVTVGITDAFASPTIVQDVNRFSSHYGLPQLTSANFQQVVAPGTFNFPENRFDPQGWYGEESLDVEWVHAMAPGAKIVYAGAQNSVTPLDHALIDMIDNHRADIITNSWGIFGEPQSYGHIKSDEQAFEQAAAEGITVLFSSGDDGDVAALTGLAQGSWPATSPFVTAVGGTSLGVRNAAGAKFEWGWGTYTSTLTGSAATQTSTSVSGTAWSPWPPTFLYGSGGGISVNFAQPSYQAGVVPTSVATATVTASGAPVTFPTPHRVVPDISMDADPNTGAIYGQTYVVSGDPLTDAGCTPLGNNLEYCERRIGGTSLASPLMAGVVALVDQARGAPIGFLNPSIYGLGSGSAAIRDVLPPASPTAVLRNTGTNPATLTTTLRTINSVPTGTTGPVIEGADTSLRTTPGWDDVTGLGTPNAPAFISALAGSH